MVGRHGLFASRVVDDLAGGGVVILTRHPSMDPKMYEGSKVWEEMGYRQKYMDPTKRFIGYWRSKREPDLPDPRDFVDTDWDPAERARVASYLTRGEEFEQWRGSSWCRFGRVEGESRKLATCDGVMGSKCLTDGVFVWPEGFSHYIAHHGVRPPQAFIDHVLGRLAS